MKGKKRFISKQLIRIFAIIFSVVTVIFSSKIIFNYLQNEQEMISSYETKKQKCDLLKEIRNECIKEGIGVDTIRISNDEIQYCIYNNNESIIFCYYLYDNFAMEQEYNAKITLTNDYRILKEDYSVKIESFDEYAKSYKCANMVLSVIYGISFILLIYILIIIISLLVKEYLGINSELEEKDR